MSPKFSIIIANYNACQLLKSTLNSIFNHLNINQVELIVVDDGSSDNSQEYIRSCPEIIPIFLDKNYGLIKARNEGIKIAKGEYILFLDNDVILYGDILKALEAVLRSQTIGIAGMCGVYLRSLTEYIHVHESLLKEPVQVHSTTGYCMAVKSKLISKGLRFDVRYRRYMAEDIDFCLQAGNIGYKVMAVPNVPLKHLEHGSVNLHDDLYEKLLYENHIKLAYKWTGKYQIEPDFVSNQIKKIASGRKFEIIQTRKINQLVFFDTKILNGR